MMIQRRVLGLCVAGLLATLVPTARASDEAPDALVRRLSEQTLNTIKADPALRNGDIQRVIALVDARIMPNVNFQRMTAQAVWKVLRERSLRAGLAAPVHPHMLRHSFASHVLQSSGDLRAVQELLGHANIATTQVYTRLDFQHLAQAYDAAHPRARRKP